MTSVPETIPVTGQEPVGDRSRPVQALAHFYAGFNARDLARVAANWDRSDEAVMDNPLGGISRGWPAIEAIYRKLFEGSHRIAVEFLDYTIVETSEMFVAIGRERGTLRSPGAEPLELWIRTSRLFRRESGGPWRQVHHHGSMEDPDLLAAYQQRVKG